MKPRQLGWLLLFLFQQDVFSVPVPNEQVQSLLRTDSKTVRVRLSRFDSVLSIQGTDLRLSLVKKPSLGSVFADHWVINCKKNTITQPGAKQIRLIPKSGIFLESPSGIFSVNSSRFREQIAVYPSSKGCTLVNHINLELYLASVVNSEFNSKWSAASVEAQVIAARTYALFQMTAARRNSKNLFDVESTEKDQMYLGLDRVDREATQIVARTKGLVLVNANTMQPIKSFYHSTCGGFTDLPERIWGQKVSGYSKRVPCPYCVHSPVYEWNLQLSASEIEKRIEKGIRTDPASRKKLPHILVANPGLWALSELNLLRAKAGELMVQFQFRNKNKPNEKLGATMNAYQFRNWLDPSRLKSTSFSVQEVLNSKGQFFSFSGKGAGHGIGLCQYGAKRMGERGHTAQQILSYYYPSAVLKRL